MPRTRLELAHRCRHQPLKLACLPIPPRAHIEWNGSKTNRNKLLTNPFLTDLKNGIKYLKYLLESEWNKSIYLEAS